MAQTSTTGALENASKEMIDAARYTAEHNAPVWGAAKHFTLKKGHDTFINVKVGQMTMSALTEGQDIVDEEEIGMTTSSITPGERGAKIILTDKLLSQNDVATFQLVGKQLGDGMKRIRETDLISLFTSLNAGVNFGDAAKPFSAANATSCVSIAKTDKMGEDMVIIHHPNAVMRLAKDLSTIGSGTIRPLPEGMSARLMGKAFKGYMIWDVPVLESGNISRDTGDDAIGVIMDNQGALGTLESLAPNTENQRDASLRAFEVVLVSDYAVFEIDDTLGAGLKYDAADPDTDAT
jgi:hypothetical protein